jgi:asparagine synthase (glutamine-hydrolysing)
MISADHRYVIVFNGEVYNFQELRQELLRAGHALHSTTDTEVILELFAREGPACVERLRGMFALAIWDSRAGELFLARDRLGIKPLYWARSHGGLAFASEVKALIALDPALRRLDAQSLTAFLLWGHVPEPRSIWQGIESLPPGTWAWFRRGQLEVQTYWQIPAELALYGTRGEALEALGPALRESVALRCIADVPLGAFLSGGIDSSSVVALMRAAGQSEIHTFSLSFPGSELDEAPFARQVARQFETRHTEVPIDDSLVSGMLEDFFRVLDQPTCDGVNTYLVSRYAKAAGMTVALSGLGGDELFGGYPSFARAERVGPFLKRIPAGLRALAASAHAGRWASWAKLESFALEGDVMAQLYLASRGLFSPSQARRLLPASDPVPSSAAADVLPVLSWSSPYHAMMQLELTRYMRNQLLRDADVFGMCHALEIRVPLIDHKVVEVVARTRPTDVLAGKQKSLLLDALPHALPALCTERKKMGFTFPFDRWLRTELRPLLESELLSRSDELLVGAGVAAVWRGFLDGKVHWSRPWSLYVLRRWAREHAVI